MSEKTRRQARILDLIEHNQIRDHDELARQLRRSGIDAGQATLSRDLRELAVVKASGIYRVSEPGAASPAADIERAVEEFLISTAQSGNILVIRTHAGTAQPLGLALDRAGWDEILGTVAGDDTVFALLRNPRVGKQVQKRLERLLAES